MNIIEAIILLLPVIWVILGIIFNNLPNENYKLTVGVGIGFGVIIIIIQTGLGLWNIYRILTLQ